MDASPSPIDSRASGAERFASLFHENFVLGIEVSSKILDMCTQHNEREFADMQYSIATSDLNSFKALGLTSRQVHWTFSNGLSCSS